MNKSSNVIISDFTKHTTSVFLLTSSIILEITDVNKSAPLVQRGRNGNGVFDHCVDDVTVEEETQVSFFGWKKVVTDKNA